MGSWGSGGLSLPRSGGLDLFSSGGLGVSRSKSELVQVEFLGVRSATGLCLSELGSGFGGLGLSMSWFELILSLSVGWRL